MPQAGKKSCLHGDRHLAGELDLAACLEDLKVCAVYLDSKEKGASQQCPSLKCFSASSLQHLNVRAWRNGGSSVLTTVHPLQHVRDIPVLMLMPFATGESDSLAELMSLITLLGTLLRTSSTTLLPFPPSWSEEQQGSTVAWALRKDEMMQHIAVLHEVS